MTFPRRSSALVMALVGLLPLLCPAAQPAHKLVTAQDGSGVFGYKDTPVQPWSGFHVHDPDRPVPPKIDPGRASTPEKSGTAPSDSVVLFDGTDLSAWQPNQYQVEDGLMVATDGPMITKREFGSCQLHLEYRVPVEENQRPMSQGNNGVLLGDAIEVQIFDSYRVKIYPDGQAAAVYSQTPPAVNACRQPGQWEVFDILYRAPKMGASGNVLAPARLTMLHNGVVVHLDQEIYGSTLHCGLGDYSTVKPVAPIGLRAHRCAVQFRNIWARPLPDEAPQVAIAAQPQPNPLLGTWRLVSIDERDAQGRSVTPLDYGPDPVGLITYDATGHMSAQAMRRDRPKLDSDDVHRATPEQAKTTLTGYNGYFGTYQIDPAAGTVVHHVEGAMIPNWVGGAQPRKFTVSGDTLILEPPEIQAAGQARNRRLTWQRIK